jgi:hypothetical protein
LEYQTLTPQSSSHLPRGHPHDFLYIWRFLGLQSLSALFLQRQLDLENRSVLLAGGNLRNAVLAAGVAFDLAEEAL